MKALVTGASGFIGSTLIEELTTLGFDVHALMRKTSLADNLEGLKFTRVEGDLGDFESLKRAAQGASYVFHLAGTVVAPDRETFFRHNAEGTERLARAVAEAVAESGVPLSRFVYVSSIAAAGPSRSRTEPRKESEASSPVSAYGESKFKGEQELLKHKDVYPISIVRPPIVYGPKDKAVFTLVQTVAKGLMPIPRGSGEDKKKYYSSIHVRDLVRGIVQSAVVPKEKVASGEIFFLSGDGVHAYDDFLGSMAEALGKDAFRIHVPKFAVRIVARCLSALGAVTGKTYPLNMDKLNEILPDYWICSNEKAKQLLGFAPEFDLARGMSDTIQWYRKKGWI